MAVSNISPTPENMDGQVVTIFIDHTSAGANEETINIPANCPYIDLNKANPIISGAIISYETDVTSSLNITPARETARGSTPDATDGDFAISDASTVVVYNSNDKNSIYALTYWAKGIKV